MSIIRLSLELFICYIDELNSILLLTKCFFFLFSFTRFFQVIKNGMPFVVFHTTIKDISNNKELETNVNIYLYICLGLMIHVTKNFFFLFDRDVDDGDLSPSNLCPLRISWIREKTALLEGFVMMAPQGLLSSQCLLLTS
jgi:hypothetical protein